MDAINPNDGYRVKLMRKIQMGPVTYRPLNKIEMKGTLVLRILEEHGEDAFDRCDPK